MNEQTADTAAALRPSSAALPSVMLALLPLMGAVLVAFLIIGLALPVLPLHVRNDLSFGPFVVGLVTGSQFAASLLSRVWAGRTCDGQGPKRAVMLGLIGAVVAGLLYLGSLPLTAQPVLSVAILLAGRGVLGAAESFIITGATVWGLARVGSQNAGKVIAWMGTAMFLAFAASAPLGIAIYQHSGFVGVAGITALAPLLTMLLVATLRAVTPPRQGRVKMLSVVRSIWLPGFGAALSSIGFGVILSFASLLFAERGWTPVWLPFTSYAGALIVARLLLGHLPDKVGGAKVALWCVFIEVIGLVLLGLEQGVILAAIGAALTGFGYALVFPALGVEAVKRAPPASRGIAMGAYTACLDLALGISGPTLGLVATGAGLGAAFLTIALIVLGAAVVAVRLHRAGDRKSHW
jgi:MFS family permease